MFDAHCPTCDARVLLTARRLVSLESTDHGHRAHLVCWCGTQLTEEIDRVATTPAPAVLRLVRTSTRPAAIALSPRSPGRTVPAA